MSERPGSDGAATGLPGGLDRERLDFLDRAAVSLAEAASGSARASTPPWATLASVHGALAATASGAVAEPAPGLRLLAEELVRVCVRLRSGQEESVHLALGVLVGALSELTRRARGVERPERDSLVRTVAIMDELRALRGAPPLSDNPVFPLPALSALHAGDAPARPPPPAMVAQVRARFGRGLSEWLRDRSNASALEPALRSLDFLSRYAARPEHRAHWMLGGALVESLAGSSRRPSPALRRVLLGMDRALGVTGSGEVDPTRGVAVASPYLDPGLLKSLCMQLTRARAPHGPRGRDVRERVDPAASFVRPSLAGAPGATARRRFDVQVRALAETVARIAAGRPPPAGLKSSLNRCLDGLALMARYGERDALQRIWPGVEEWQARSGEGGKGGEPPGETADVDWPWLALSLRALQERKAAPGGDPAGEVRRQREATARELVRASQALERLDAAPAASGGGGGARPAVPGPPAPGVPVGQGSPFVAVPPAPLRSAGAILEPANAPDSLAGTAAPALPGIEDLAERASALAGPADSGSAAPGPGRKGGPEGGSSDAAAPAGDAAPGELPAYSVDPGPVAPAREDADGERGELEPIPVDAALLENLGWVARAIGTSRSATERHVGGLREGALDLDRAVRSISDDLRRLRRDTEAAPSPVEPASRAEAGPGDAPRDAEPPGGGSSLGPEQLQELRARIESLSQNVSTLSRIQLDLESMAGAARDQLQRQARATQTLQAGLARTGAVSFGAVWDAVVPGVRAEASRRGLPLVLALTGAGVTLGQSSAAAVESGLASLLAALVDALAGQVREPGQVVVDVSAADAGPTLVVDLAARGVPVDLASDPGLARALDAINAGAPCGWMRLAGPAALWARWAIAPKVSKVVPIVLSTGEGAGAVPHPEGAGTAGAVTASIALAAESVSGVVHAQDGEADWAAGELRLRGESWAIVPAGSILAGRASGASRGGSGGLAEPVAKWVLVQAQPGRFAVPAMEVHEPAVVTVDPPPPQLRSLAAVRGASVLADDEVLVVLEPDAWRSDWVHQ